MMPDDSVIIYVISFLGVSFRQYSRLVSLQEVRKNEYNLNITRYVNLSKEEERIDLLAVNRELKKIDEQIENARNRHNDFLRELGLPEI